jgi:hypothetical protein
MKATHILLFIIACCISVPVFATEAQKTVLDAQTLVDGWEASYCHINSFKVRCAKVMLDEKGQNPSRYKIVRSIYQERIQDSNKFLIRTGDSPQAFDGTGYYQVSSFDGNVGRDYRRDRGQARGRIYRGLEGRASETMDMLQNFLESTPDNKLNSVEGPRWKALKEQYPLGIPSFFGWYNGALNVKVRPYLEYVAGEPCHVLELDLEGHSRAYWFAHEKGMLLMKKKLVLGGGKVATKEVKEIASVRTDTGILWYPRVIMEEQIRGPNYSYTMKMTFEEYVPYFKAPDETFSYAFPSGTLVYDKIKDMEYIVGPYVPKKSGSLIGKTLLDFNDIDIKLPADTVKDKIIIVCFFDMNQRPSRNCMLQLRKKIQKSLRQKVSSLSPFKLRRSMRTS